MTPANDSESIGAHGQNVTYRTGGCMKRLVLALILAVLACRGPEGPAGPTGPQGPPGMVGPSGSDNRLFYAGVAGSDGSARVDLPAESGTLSQPPGFACYVFVVGVWVATSDPISDASCGLGEIAGTTRLRVALVGAVPGQSFYIAVWW